jgi:very-short-patch-repair endonuclease
MTPPRRTLIRTRSRAHQLASAALEERLWRRLRRHRLGRPMFHRDYPVGSAILEFYCPVARLVVEIDRGRGPGSPVRDRWCAAHGISRLRIPASRILDDPDTVAADAFQCARELRRALLSPYLPREAAGGGPLAERSEARVMAGASLRLRGSSRLN